MKLIERIRSMFSPTAAPAAETEVAMSDTPTATPAASGGLTKDEATKLIADIVTKALAPVSEAMAHQATSIKALTEAQAKAPTAEHLAGLVTKQLDEHQKAQADAAAKNQAKAALREKVITAHLPGVPASVLASLPDTEDETALTTAAKGLQKELETTFKYKLPDVGGAAKDGGTTPAAEAQAKPASGGFLKMANASPAPSV